jgi:nitrite reductase (NADH) small subunit
MSAVVGTSAARQVNLGPVDRIPLGEGRTYAIDGLDVAVFRPRSGGLFATQAHCPHASGPLADGFIGNGTVVCPFHAYRFDLATGCPQGNACAPLTTYPAGVTGGGDILVTLAGR